MAREGGGSAVRQVPIFVSERLPVTTTGGDLAATISALVTGSTGAPSGIVAPGFHAG